MCSAGCWQGFYDGPCAPNRDAGLLDVGGDTGELVDTGEFGDTGEPGDTGELDDAGAIADAGALSDTPTPGDAGTSDTGVDAPIMTDAGVPETMTYCIDIAVSNTCVMTVTPTEIDIPEGQTAYFCWRNLSRDYPVDVWLSYGGGYTDLAPGTTWNERPGHCLGPLAHDEYADISTACSSQRFLIHCL